MLQIAGLIISLAALIVLFCVAVVGLVWEMMPDELKFPPPTPFTSHVGNYIDLWC